MPSPVSCLHICLQWPLLHCLRQWLASPLLMRGGGSGEHLFSSPVELSPRKPIIKATLWPYIVSSCHILPTRVNGNPSLRHEQMLTWLAAISYSNTADETMSSTKSFSISPSSIFQISVHEWIPAHLACLHSSCEGGPKGDQQKRTNKRGPLNIWRAKSWELLF